MSIMKVTANGVFRGYICYPVIRREGMNTPVGIDEYNGRLYTSAPTIDSIGAARADTVNELASRLSDEIATRTDAINHFAQSVSNSLDDFNTTYNDIRIEPLRERIAVLENTINNLIGESTPDIPDNAEVINARTSVHNHEYNTLGEHIRSETFDIKINDVQQYEVCEWGDTFDIQHQIDRNTILQTNNVAYHTVWKKGSLNASTGEFVGDTSNNYKTTDFIHIQGLNSYKMDIEYISSSNITSNVFSAIVVYNANYEKTRSISGSDIQGDGSVVFELQENEEYIRVCAPFIRLKYFRIYPSSTTPYEKISFANSIWYSNGSGTISKSVNDAITELYERVGVIESRVNTLSSTGWSQSAINALIDCLNGVTWDSASDKQSKVNTLIEALSSGALNDADTTQY